jgi:DNA-binding NtrC family response regulator
MTRDSRAGGAILVIADEMAVRDAFYGLLRAAGYRVACTASQEEALVALSRARFDLVLIDGFSAPAPLLGDGQALVSRIEQRAGYRPRVLLLDGRRQSDVMPRTDQAASGSLPLDQAAVLVAVRDCLADHH